MENILQSNSEGKATGAMGRGLHNLYSLGSKNKEAKGFLRKPFLLESDLTPAKGIFQCQRGVISKVPLQAVTHCTSASQGQSLWDGGCCPFFF